MHRVDAFCCCRCCTFPCLSVFDKKTGESCKNRSTAEKLEGTSRGVDADPVLFPPPSLPRCCSTHVADKALKAMHVHIHCSAVTYSYIHAQNTRLHHIPTAWHNLLLLLTFAVSVTNKGTYSSTVTHVRYCPHMETSANWNPHITMTLQWTVLSHHINQIVNKPEHCLHYLLPAAREQSVTDRLRSANKLPRIFAKTTHTPV